MPVPVLVKIIDNTTLFVKFDDGIEGNISINSKIEKANFEDVQVCIDTNSKNIFISDTELCKNAIYKQLQLKSLMSRLKIDIDKI